MCAFRHVWVKDILRRTLKVQRCAKSIIAGGKFESDIKDYYDNGKAEIAVLCDVDDGQCVKHEADFRQNCFTGTPLLA